MRAGARLASVVMAHVMRTSRGLPRLDISTPREPVWLGHSRGGLASSASRGLDPREGLGCLVDEDGLYGLLLGHAVGRRQASLGTPVPRTPTVAPGPKVRSGASVMLDLTDMTHQKFHQLLPPVGILGTGVPRLACLWPTAWLR